MSRSGFIKKQHTEFLARLEGLIGVSNEVGSS